MNTDPLNEIFTSQKSTEKGLCEELEGYFISIKAIYLFQQQVTPSRNSCHGLP